jgi:transposase
MEVVYPCCCGLDVHKKSITACVLWAEAKGKSRKEKKRFGTFTHDLLQLADWLEQCGVTHAAMESTGVYWKPVWNILAEQFEVLLVNAQHIKAVPGRKTDQKDSEWIADLLQHGLLRGSFVPPQPIRELRDLTRYRVSLVQEINRIANRIQKVLEDANIKLASVATDALGASGESDLGGDAGRGARRCPVGRDVQRAAAEQDPGTEVGAGRSYDRASSIFAPTALRAPALHGIETE